MHAVVKLNPSDMKTLMKSIFVILMLAPFALFAQNGMQDVIYLKDGSIYKGTIIETVPNVSYKIESRDGNVFAVKIDEVEKITKEEIERKNRSGYGWGHHRWRNDSIHGIARNNFSGERSTIVRH